jgi:hypothetical protein
MFNWAIDDTTFKALGAIGGVISFLWGVGWAIFQYRKQSVAAQNTARRKGLEPERRPISLLRMVGTVLAIWATVLVMAGTTLWLWREFVVEKKPLISLVCRAENGDGCPAGATLVGCADATPAIKAAQDRCTAHPETPSTRVIISHDGHQCGTTVWEIACKPKY